MWNWVVEPRFNETDALGHINNTTVPNWFEFGRNPVARIFVPSQRIEDWNIILRRIEIEFDAELFYGSPVEVRTRVERIGTTSVTLAQEAWQQGRCCARGLAVLVHFDFERRSKLAIPEQIRAQLEAAGRTGTAGAQT